MAGPTASDGNVGTSGAADAQQAWQRLASSREDIGRWLAGQAVAPAVPPGDPGAAAPPRAPASSSMLAVLSGLLLRRWLGASAPGRAEHGPDPGPHLGLALAQASLAPLAQRHPWALMAGAAALGATLVVAWPVCRVVGRPLRQAWRWLPWVAPWVAPLVMPLFGPSLAAAAARGVQPASGAVPSSPSSPPPPVAPASDRAVSPPP